MMNKEQKKNYISEMKKFFEASDSVLVTHYQGLSVNQLDVLIQVFQNLFFQQKYY